MAFYITRKSIKKIPGKVINLISKPNPIIIEGFGRYSVVGEICKQAGYKKVLLVTDSNLFKLGFHEEIVSSLSKNKIKCAIFSDITSEPTIKIIEEGRKAALCCEAQCIIALGGGSVLDSSKMISAWVSRPFDKVSCPKFLLLKEKATPIISIPTTAGTGAEITVGAIVKKDSGSSKNSTVISGLNISHIILDGKLTLNAPLNVTASCAIDALSHGLEGTVGDVNVSIQDKMKSFECVKLVLENLNLLLDNSNDEEAHQAMSKAALYGGNAINKQLAGYVHAFAHSLGAKYHIPHGLAIAICINPVMEYQKKYCIPQLAELSHYCKLSTLNDSDEVAADSLLKSIDNLLYKSKLLPSSLEIPREDYRILSKMILKDSINYSVPVVFTKLDIFKILGKINELRG